MLILTSGAGLPIHFCSSTIEVIRDRLACSRRTRTVLAESAFTFGE